jgi:protein O-mannosyl-transferase
MTTTAPASSPSDSARRGRRHLLVALGLAAFTLLLFLRTVGHDFIVFDDQDYVVRNYRVLQGLTPANVAWAFTTLKLVNWHPLTWLSHMADVSLWGLWPGGHHLTSVVWHALNAALLYLVLVDLTARPGRALLVAALFAVHPLRMESVAWVSERKDVLSGFFFLLTIGAYGRYARAATRAKSWKWYALTLLSLALGLMCKSMLVTVPCVLLLLDLWPLARLRRDTLGRVVIEKIPMIAMSAAFSVVTVLAQRHGGAIPEERYYPTAIRFGNAIWAYGRYLRKTVWPSDLAIFYPYVGLGGEPFPWGRAAASGVVLLIVTAIAIALWRRERAVLVGWLWFLGMLVPTIGVVQVGAQSMADRYSYLPQIGLLIAIVWGVGMLSEYSAGRANGASAGLVRLGPLAGALAVIALAITTFMQLPNWQNTITLFDHAVRVTDRNTRAHVCLGLGYTDAGNPEMARRHYVQALQYDPRHAEGNNNYGNLLLDMGRSAEAEQHFRRALSSSPRYAEAHNNLANVLAARGDAEGALQHYRLSVRLDPDKPQSHYNYGLTLAGIGRFKEAQAELERALQLRPDYPEARYTYGVVMASLGYEVAATGQLREANFLRPDWVDALRSLAWLLATSPEPKVRNGAQAIIVAERANQLTGYENGIALDTLAAAYAEAGRFDNAVATESRAIELARAASKSDLAEHFAARLALYRENKPFHRVAGATTQPFEP